MPVVSGLQMTLIVDGRSVCANFHNLQKITEMVDDRGTLGRLLRQLADSPSRIPNEGDTMNLSLKDAPGGLVAVQGGRVVKV